MLTSPLTGCCDFDPLLFERCLDELFLDESWDFSWLLLFWDWLEVFWVGEIEFLDDEPVVEVEWYNCEFGLEFDVEDIGVIGKGNGVVGVKNEDGAFKP